MSEDLKWLIGIAVGLGSTFTVALIATFRSLSGMIKSGNDQLHGRINRVRDEYVRRVDLDDHVSRLRDDFRELKDETKETRQEMKETNKRLDQVLAALAQDKK